jgi:deoxyribonuclease-4
MLEELDRELGLAALKCWHLNDSKGALGSHLDRHVHIGEGEIGTESFRLVVNDPRWDGIPMLLETPKEDDLKEDLMNLQRLCALLEDTTRIPAGLSVTEIEAAIETELATESDPAQLKATELHPELNSAATESVER